MEGVKNIFSNAFKVDQDQECWQDCEVRFDVKVADIALRSGEIVCDGELDSVEDLKGGNGELGSLKVTNLRLLWVSNEGNSVNNLSIGYGTITSLTLKSLSSRTTSSPPSFGMFKSSSTQSIDSRLASKSATASTPSAACMTLMPADSRILVVILRTRGSSSNPARCSEIEGEIEGGDVGRWRAEM